MNNAYPNLLKPLDLGFYTDEQDAKRAVEGKRVEIDQVSVTSYKLLDFNRQTR